MSFFSSHIMPLNSPCVFKFISLRNIGDAFLELIVLSAFASLYPQSKISLTVHKSTFAPLAELCKLLDSNVYLIPYIPRLADRYIELNPLPRSPLHLTRLFLVYLSPQTQCFRIRRTSYPIVLSLRQLYYFFENLYFSLRASALTRPTPSDSRQQHLLDTYIYILQGLTHFNTEIIRSTIVKQRDIVRTKLSHHCEAPDSKAYFPSPPSPGISNQKNINSYVVHKLYPYDNSGIERIIFNSDNSTNPNSRSYHNIPTLLQQLLSFSLNHFPDSFPAHLSVYLGCNSVIFLPGYNLGHFFPYPRWFESNASTHYILSSNQGCFNCYGSCNNNFACMDWNSILSNLAHIAPIN